MHKSKENANGTFSIGKTWNLDDLSRIESFTGPNVPPNHKEWASETGFLVVLGKPYFWQAQTDKEKKFFIASMIKIYGKYTSGKVPELAGFDPRDMEQVMGAGNRPANPQQRPPALDQRPSQQSSSSTTPRGQSPASTPAPSEPPPRFPRTNPAIRPPPSNNGSPAGSFDSTASRGRPPMNRIGQGNKSQESLPASIGAKSEDAASLPPRSRNGMGGPGAFGRFGDPPPEPSEPPTQPLPQPPSLPPQQSQPPPPRVPKGEQPPPERRRPPMDPTRPQDRDLVPPPLMSQGQKQPVMPPPRSTERMSPRKDSLSQRTGSLANTMRDRSTPPPAMASLEPKTPDRTKTESPKTEPPVGLKSPSGTSLPRSEPPTPAAASEGASPPEPPPVPEEETRPGLGPMIKKRSKGELAGIFRKAASAATTTSAFKPRPGGAGERLRQLAQQQMQNKPADEPDGITGVVPAPPRPASRDDRPASRDTKEDPTPEPTPPPKAPQRTSVVPEVKISVPPSSRPSTSQGEPKEVPKALVKAREPEAEPHLPPRRSAAAGNDAKYLQSLGVDPTVLDNRSDEFGRWLDYFGWVPGDQMQTRNIDDMKVDLERELNKAQAGGWLARFEEEDERVDAIKQGLDLAMAECEEMDNLLTLYTVELSVSVVAAPRCSAILIQNRLCQRILPTLKPRVRVCRSRQQTRNCSRRRWNLCSRLVPSHPATWRFFG